MASGEVSRVTSTELAELQALQAQQVFVEITVERADDLQNQEMMGTSDPYVKLWLGEQGPWACERQSPHKTTFCLACWRKRLWAAHSAGGPGNSF